MKPFPFMLAPMEDITGPGFRSICHRYGADLTFTELTRVEGLARRNASTWSRLQFPDETPVVIQLLGANEQHFKRFLSLFRPEKSFKGFNLNCGCPSPYVVKLGQGAAMIRRISKVRKVVAILKERGYPVSIKMRLGMSMKDKEYKSYLNLIKAVDADFFIVHARYASQHYEEPSDFAVFEECVRTGKSIIANGDIKTAEQVTLLEQMGVKGAMIGRAAVLEPSIFNRLKGKYAPPAAEVMKEYEDLAQKYNEPFRYRKNVLKHWRESLKGQAGFIEDKLQE